MNRRQIFALPLAIMSLTAPALASTVRGTLYKDRNCSCCEGHAAHLKENGIEVDIVAVDDIAAFSRKAGIPEDYLGCHTILLQGYTIEGHVSASLIHKLLTEKPTDITALAIPGMPAEVPGMQGPSADAPVMPRGNSPITPHRREVRIQFVSQVFILVRVRKKHRCH